MTKQVLVIQPVHDAGMALLRARDDVAFSTTAEMDEASLVSAVRKVRGIVVRTAHITKAVIEAAQDLEIVSRHGVGYDTVDIDVCTARGIPVTITPGTNAVSVAEHTMSLMLALAKQCLFYDRAARNQQFEAARNSMRSIEIDGKTLLLIGFGRTGSRVAPRARAFGMRVYACDPYIDQALIEDAGCTPVANFREILPQIDVLSVHTPLNAETRAMVGGIEIGALRRGALVVNCARGGIVEEAALVRALESGHLAGAGLDVFESEPAAPRPDNPLFHLDNVIVSSHCAGVTREASARSAEWAARNVLDAFDGKLDPEVVVNQEVLG